jgi:type II secretion system protein J
MRVSLQCRRSRQRGFTLLELLIATAVGAIVLLVVQTTYFGALRLHNTTHERLEEDLVIQRTLGIIRRDLAGIMLPGGTLAGQLQSESYASTLTGSYGDRVMPDLFTNSGKVDGWNPFSEVQMVSYYLAPSEGADKARNLVRVVTRNLLPVQESEPELQVVLGGVESATTMFYDGYGWVDQWDSEATTSLPTAIKFTLVMAPRAGEQVASNPIDLVVPVWVKTTTQAQAEEEESSL